MADDETIFAEAVRLGSSRQRAEFLNRACGADAQRRREIEAMLLAHDRAAGNAFLESPPAGIDLPTSPDTSADVPPAAEQVGSVIGDYKLLEQIGEGGMGVVYMAEQLRPVRRRVALKIIKPGLDTKQVIARLEAERQALAMMDHPNIAKVFDAGATDAGRPYFVMELVRGIPITDYCDQNQLTPRRRLELFVQVCQAVQHAHQKGIIHRDLKPSNVLVTLNEGKPTPKVIDFGIAKATAGHRLTEQTLFTEFRQLIGTPLYMSPEQAEMRPLLDVDTRSDVYSLGVLLYELLTGTTPFDKDRLAQAVCEEVRRIIREEDPPTPSTRLSTVGQTLATISTHRGTDPKRLGQLLRGELDWIVMQALEKDRTRRYETADGLARDVERYLSDEPVEACPPSRTYRLRKFARRNKPVISTAALIMAVLLLATGISTWQAVRARHATASALAAEGQTARERDQARTEKRRADEQAAIATAVNDFLNKDVLGQASPFNQVQTEIKMAPDRDLKVRDALDRAANRIGTRFQGRPLTEAAIHFTIGNAYGDLGEWAKAEEHLQSALRLRRKAMGDKHADTFESIQGLVDVYAEQHRYDKALALAEQELERQRTFLGDEARNTLLSEKLLADVQFRSGQLTNAESLRRKLLAACQTVLGDQDSLTLAVANDLAITYYDLKQVDKAEPILLRAVAAARKAGDEALAFRSIANLATCYHFQGRYAEAEQLYLETLHGEREVFGEWDGLTLYTLRSLAWTYYDQGQYEKAKPLYEQVVKRWRQITGPEGPWDLFATEHLASLYLQEGRYADAEPLWRQLSEWSLAHPAWAHARGMEAVHFVPKLIDCYRSMGKEAQAAEWDKKLRPLLRELLDGQIQEKTSALTTRPAEAGLLADRGMLQWRSGRFKEAAADYAKAIRLEPANQNRWHMGVPLLLQSGDVEGYRRQRTLELAQFAASGSVDAHCVAKDSLILPAEGEDLRIAAALARRALADSPTEPWFYQTRGMAEYRQGHYEHALLWLAVGCDDHEYRGTSCQLFLAMACAQLGCMPQAHSAYRDAMGRLAKLPQLQDGDLRQMPADWVLCDFAGREAQEIVAEKGGDATPSQALPPWREALREIFASNLSTLSVAINAQPAGSAQLPELLWCRVEIEARLGRLRDAEYDRCRYLEARLAQIRPDDHPQLLGLLPMQLYLGNARAYRDGCRRMLETLSSTTDRSAIEHTVKLCALSPGAVPDFEPALRLSDRLVASAGQASKWDQLARGMAEYRSGQFAAAIDRLNQGNRIFAKSGPVEAQATASFFIAMSQHQLGHLADARDSVRDARQQLGRSTTPKVPASMFPEQNWLMAQIVAREADRMFGPDRAEVVGPGTSPSGSDLAPTAAARRPTLPP